MFSDLSSELSRANSAVVGAQALAACGRGIIPPEHLHFFKPFSLLGAGITVVGGQMCRNLKVTHSLNMMKWVSLSPTSQFHPSPRQLVSSYLS